MTTDTDSIGQIPSSLEPYLVYYKFAFNVAFQTCLRLY